MSSISIDFYKNFVSLTLPKLEWMRGNNLRSGPLCGSTYVGTKNMLESTLENNCSFFVSEIENK